MHDLETIKRLNNEAAARELGDPAKDLEIKEANKVFLEKRQKANRESQGEAFQIRAEFVETVSYYTLRYLDGAVFHIEAKVEAVYIGKVRWTVFTDEFIEITDLPMGKVVIEDLQKSQEWKRCETIEVK